MVYDSNEHIVGVKYSYSMSRVLAYDNRNRVIGDTSYDGSGNIVSYDTFSYDNDDNITSFQELRITTGGIFTDGPVIVVYDHHPNPHAKFGKLIYYADGDFKYSFKENSISEKAGSYEEKVRKPRRMWFINIIAMDNCGRNQAIWTIGLSLIITNKTGGEQLRAFSVRCVKIIERLR